MKDLLNQLDKAFENKVRLGIMSALMVNDRLDFNYLKELLDVTDGNLASHLKGLEQRGFVDFEKGFDGRKPKTTYHATKEGKKAFAKHIEALEELLGR
jgi:DNA-binding MarR family transcriptional regulator